MFTLPTPSQALVASFPVPRDLRALPDHLPIRMILGLTSKYMELVPDLSNPRIWVNYKSRVAERCQSLKIVDFYPRLYENNEYPVRLLFQFSYVDTYRQWALRLARRSGYEDVATQPVEIADPVRLRAFVELLLKRLDRLTKRIDRFDDWDRLEATCKHYWQEVHPNLPPDEQRLMEKDCQLFASLFFYILHNSVSVMAYGESLASLVQRALAGGADADKAMCKAVRVDNSLRRHPQFMERHHQAHGESDVDFLLAYNNPATPLTNRIRYPGLYFLFATLDGFGLLDQLTNGQVLDLCDHARLEKYQNRIEDEGYLAKRRIEYLRHKYIRMSMH